MEQKKKKRMFLLLLALVAFMLMSFGRGNLSTKKRIEKFINSPYQEGGLSRATTDTSSAYPCPDAYDNGNGIQTGWHTNKGVTWTTYKAYCTKMDLDISSAVWFEMKDSLWYAIFQEMFWNAWSLDELEGLPRVQAVIVSWAWGSGVGGSRKRLSKFITDSADTSMTMEEIRTWVKENITRSNEQAWFLAACNNRYVQFQAMNQPANLAGWKARLDRFVAEFKDM